MVSRKCATEAHVASHVRWPGSARLRRAPDIAVNCAGRLVEEVLDHQDSFKPRSFLLVHSDSIQTPNILSLDNSIVGSTILSATLVERTRVYFVWLS